ncbi:MAG: acetyl-CoA carboxylase carboxyltransferase subunit alpha/beta [SAR202 cluster bacterium]|nr:acetyl-CoA carboxylase carboxyltransferase subunit alpha/beta [SAR202 cluster bacterium]
MVRNLTDLLSSVVKRSKDDEEVVATRDICLVCDSGLSDSSLYTDFRVCHLCRFHYSMTARERIGSLADPGSFREINRSIISLDPLSFSSRVSYKQRLFRDQRRTGLTEAVVTGTCTVGGSPVVLVVLDFGFMGGTMGCVVGEKVALALEHSAKRKLPTIAVVTSGGARIQEGVLSLMQMAKTSVAATQTTAKGLPFISVLANPATGQAYASFANLADIVLAEPGAIVGYSPLRVLRDGRDRALGTEAHTAEAHLEHGLLDAVVDRTQLRDLLAVLVDLLGPQYRLTPLRKTKKPEARPEPAIAWNSVQLARHDSRPSSIDFIARILTNFVELHGDRAYRDDPAVVCGMGQLGGQTVMVIGQERGPRDSEVGRHGSRISPEGFRKAQRAIGLASKFDIPLITLIDTPGPDASVEAEHHGMGNAIAATMAQMAALEVPSISVVIGEGGSGGAVALGVADRVLMLENAIYSAVTPEDAAGLIYQDEARADEAAESLRLTAQDCHELGIVDLVVPEPPGGAHANPEEAARQLRRDLLQELAEIQSRSRRRLLRDRYKKFRNIGEYSSHFRAAITREVNALQGLVTTGVKRITRRSRRDGELTDDVISGSG